MRIWTTQTGISWQSQIRRSEWFENVGNVKTVHYKKMLDLSNVWKILWIPPICIMAKANGIFGSLVCKWWTDEWGIMGREHLKRFRCVCLHQLSFHGCILRTEILHDHFLLLKYFRIRYDLSIYLSIYLSIKVYMCVYACVFQSKCHCDHHSPLFLHLSIYLSIYLSKECSQVVRETEVQSQVESYQRLKNGTWCLLA